MSTIDKSKAKNATVSAILSKNGPKQEQLVLSLLSLLMLFGLMPPLPAAIVHRLPQNAVNLSKKSLQLLNIC